MTTGVLPRRPVPWPARLPFYYGWVSLTVAALAMTATLPGRTHGLGLITEPLLRDLSMSEVQFGTINGWAIVLGAVLCLPVGRLIDRLGSRLVLTGVALALGAAVVLMSRATDMLVLFGLLVLVRGLGQGSLSVVSMALVGKWFTRRLGWAMAVYTILMGMGFIATVVGVTQAVEANGWRTAWLGVGLFLIFGLAPLGWLLGYGTPESCGLPVEAGPPAVEIAVPAARDYTLAEALRAPAFWTFSLSASLFNLMWSAVTLFQKPLLTAQWPGRPHFPGGDGRAGRVPACPVI